MPVKPERYKTWLAAFVGLTVVLGLTSADSIDRPPDNNRRGAASSTASAAGADSIPPTAFAADPAVSASLSESGDASADDADVVFLPAVDQAIYYWVGRTRGFVRRYWSRPSDMPATR